MFDCFCRDDVAKNLDFERLKILKIRGEHASLKRQRPHGYDSMSCLARRESTGTSEAFIHFIYNPDLAIPRFLVSYRLEARASLEGMENFGETQARESKENFCRVPLTPASKILENDPKDYHFRMALSQFHQMSTNQKHKVVQLRSHVDESL